MTNERRLELASRALKLIEQSHHKPAALALLLEVFYNKGWDEALKQAGKQ